MKYLLLTYLLVTVVLPVLQLFSTIEITHIREIIESVQFFPMLRNSLITTVIATVISVVLAFFFVCKHRRDKSAFDKLFRDC